MTVWFATSVFGRCRFSIFESHTDQVGHRQVIIVFSFSSWSRRCDVAVAAGRVDEEVLQT